VPPPAERGNGTGSSVNRSPADAAKDGDMGMLEALITSKLFQDYERAFTEATGLPVALRPVESWQLPLHGKRNEGPFCAIMAERSRTCGSCLAMQERLSQAGTLEPATAVCPAGLSETIVPVRLGERLIGFLQTGQVFRKEPTQAQFENTIRLLTEWGVEMDRVALRQAYFATRVVPARHHESVIKLLSIFAQHLSMLSNQILVQHQNAEPPVISRAKAYIQEHQTEDLRLGQVAKAVNTSLFYFCKIFKKATGLNFTDYLSRIRIEKSKNLLLNPNLRVSEIAFEVGFQSLTHFNRVFKRAAGQSPTHYREQLLGL
jgi:AraC-like DNA-binding protein/ligand-binding sensor protein